MPNSSYSNHTDTQDSVTATGKMEMAFKIAEGRIYLLADITEAVEFFNAEKANANEKARSEAEAAFKANMGEDDA